MSARVIVSGSLTKPPQRKISAKGNPYLLLNLREGNGDAARYWAGFVFSEFAIEQIDAMQVGEPLAVAGDFAAEIYKPDVKEPRVSLKITIDGVMSPRRPKKDAKPKADAEQRASNQGARDPDDDIPF